MEQDKIHIKRAFTAGKMAAEKGNDPETIARLMMRVYNPTLRWDTLGDSQQQTWLEFANKFPKADKPFDEEDRIKENILSFKVNKPTKPQTEKDKQSLGYKHLFKQPGQEPKPNEKHYRGWAEYDKEMNPEEVEESRIMDRNARINAYYVSTKGQRHRVAENIPYYLLDKLVSLLTKKYSITMNDIEVRPADATQYRRTYQPELKEGKFKDISIMIDDYYNMSLSDVKFYGMYGITRQQFAKDYAQYLDKPKQVNEFAPDEGGESRKFIPWTEFVDQLKQILHKDFDCKESINIDVIKAKFVPYDPMELGPTQIYSYFERRAGRKGANSVRGQIQVGKFIKGQSGLMTSYSLLKGTEFERYFDLTFDNLYKIANIIKGNTQGRLETTQEVEEAGITRRGILKGLAGAGALGAAGKASAIAGAFPSPSTRAKWAADAAASNKAMAAQEAERQRRENAARAAKLAQDTKDVERLNKVNYHGKDAPQPSNATWDGDSSFLYLDDTQYAMASRMPISGDVPSDMKLIVTQEGRQVYIWTRRSLKGVQGHYFYPAEKPNTIDEDYLDE